MDISALADSPLLCQCDCRFALVFSIRFWQ
uniref:Uncharacterized protein n=1 Tax=Arundo donax TaxID=35708 RepID=A0A0A9CE17_ARUDO